MGDQGWDDDGTDHNAPQGCAWIMTVVALVCALGVIALGGVAVFGLKVFLDLVEALSG
ncbi:hypothetical protein ACFW9O_20815 [Streptomyces sp. NPDC059499]|uniref:hypothetical protein n=1 Tax=Streptomyces sp. NPDC059499 TaxID=3346852 RepID=UPI0036B48BE9